jgi:hypothetical protein
MGKWGGNPIDKRLCEERWDRIEVSFMNWQKASFWTTSSPNPFIPI